MSGYVLGLETGIDGGSLSIFEEGGLVGECEGGGIVSKSEDLLLLLDGLLAKHRVRKRDIRAIRISDEPGSSTGLRIGLATARGLGDALSIPVSKTSILEAMATTLKDSGTVISALATQKKIIYYRTFVFNDRSELVSSDDVIRTQPSEFIERLMHLSSETEGSRFVFNERLAKILEYHGALEKAVFKKDRASIVRDSPAEILGRS